MTNLRYEARQILTSFGVDVSAYEGHDFVVTSPIDGKPLVEMKEHNTEETEKVMSQAVSAFEHWQNVPAPRRGELIRILGNLLRENKQALAELVTIECGKILEEGLGEVQEMIDICDFAVGLSRQLHGLTIASERPNHTMQENWLPLGPVLIISAFNFPVAVWSWNVTLAIVCGNPCVWKPSEKTPLTALACQALFEKACEQFDDAPKHLSQLVIGLADRGEQLVADSRMELVSATGSTRMGAAVAPVVAGRFGKLLLELGGNNAAIITEHADLAVAIPSIVFGAVGTCGQRCTSTRRLLVHRSQLETVCEKLKSAYQSLEYGKIGNPLNEGTLVGPLIDETSFKTMQKSLEYAASEGGEVHGGGRFHADDHGDAFYVQPAWVKMPEQTPVVMEETFAPILYVVPFDTIEEAVKLNNEVSQGLSSTIFTTDMREAEFFRRHSDCGIANINIGTSGAEIGGAFGGEKETGGGRESGSDAWKNYMRRQTSTSYYGTTPPALAQGIVFDL